MLAGMSAAAALVALGVAVVSHRRALAPIAITLASAVSLVASLLIGLGDGGRADGPVLIEAVAMIALIFLAVRQAPGRRALAAASLAVVAEAAMILVSDGAGGSLQEAAGAFAFWSLGAAGAAGAALHLNALDAERARSVADARRSQRLELARDLHDFVAHDVSAIVVDAQAGRMVGASAPENALAALERIEEDALRALAAMDRTVQALREADDDASGPAAGADARTRGAARAGRSLRDERAGTGAPRRRAGSARRACAGDQRDRIPSGGRGADQRASSRARRRAGWTSPSPRCVPRPARRSPSR